MMKLETKEMSDAMKNGTTATKFCGEASMVQTRGGARRVLSLAHSLALSFALSLLVLPSIASATLMTLTFDDGAHDETIEFPGGILHGPYDWIESNGIRAAGFWAFDVGTPDAIFQQGHTHIRENFFGDAAERQHSWTNDLQGLFISLEEGQSFDIVSIDYTIRSRETLTDPTMQRLPWAWGPEDAQILISTDFDPTVADLESQWTNFAIDDMGLPFNPTFTREITGLTGLTSFYLANNIHLLNVDNIVLDVYDTTPIPEPSTALLIGLGMTALASRRQKD